MRNLIKILKEILEIVDRLRITDSSMCEDLQSIQQHLEFPLNTLRADYKRLSTLDKYGEKVGLEIRKLSLLNYCLMLEILELSSKEKIHYLKNSD